MPNGGKASPLGFEQPIRAHEIETIRKRFIKTTSPKINSIFYEGKNQSLAR